MGESFKDPLRAIQLDKDAAKREAAARSKKIDQDYANSDFGKLENAVSKHRQETDEEPEEQSFKAAA